MPGQCMLAEKYAKQICTSKVLHDFMVLIFNTHPYFLSQSYLFNHICSFLSLLCVSFFWFSSSRVRWNDFKNFMVREEAQEGSTRDEERPSGRIPSPTPPPPISLSSIRSAPPLVPPLQHALGTVVEGRSGHRKSEGADPTHVPSARPPHRRWR